MVNSVDDNFLASYVDGKATPLEKIAYNGALSSSEIVEALDISNDIKAMRHYIDRLKPERIPACDEYIHKVCAFRDLKLDLKTKSSDKIV